MLEGCRDRRKTRLISSTILFYQLCFPETPYEGSSEPGGCDMIMIWYNTIWYDIPALSNLKHISGSLKICTISKTTEREKQSHSCTLPLARCHGLQTSLQLHTEHPLLWPLTHTSALCCKKRDFWLSPPETDMQLELQVGDCRRAPATASGHREATVLLITTLSPHMTALAAH